MNAALAHVERPALDHALIQSYVGNGASMLVKRALGGEASEDLEKRTLAFFLKFYRTHALANTRLYEGVRGALDQAVALDHRLAVLTNKPVNISRDIVISLGLHQHFFRVYGGDSFDRKKPDPAGINALRKETGASIEDTLMIGDSSVDIQTARNAGVRSCGVLWGFQPQTFGPDAPAENKPDYVVRTAAELQQLWQPVDSGASSA